MSLAGPGGGGGRPDLILTAPESLDVLLGSANAELNLFSRRVGMVIIDGARLLKPPTPHGMARVPVCLGLVGSLPQIQANGQVQEWRPGEKKNDKDDEKNEKK